MRKKLALLALTVALAVPAGSFAGPPNFECPGGPPGHCKSGGNSNHSQKQQQQQQQQQTQSQRQCIIVIGLLQPANC